MTSPVPDTRNFSKFHVMSPAVPSASGVGRQLLVDRVAVVAVHVDLLEQREGHAVGGRAELLDLLRRARLLAHELVAGEADHREATVAVGLLQTLEALVLRRQPALGGHVDHQERLAGVVAERRVVALEGVDGDVVKGHAGRGYRSRPTTAAGRPAAPICLG